MSAGQIVGLRVPFIETFHSVTSSKHVLHFEFKTDQFAIVKLTTVKFQSLQIDI